MLGTRLLGALCQCCLGTMLRMQRHALAIGRKFRHQLSVHALLDLYVFRKRPIVFLPMDRLLEHSEVIYRHS